MPCRPLVIAALVPLVIGIGAEGYVRLESGRLLEHYQRIDRQAQAVEIIDARGRWLGIVPRAMEPHTAPEIRLNTPPNHRVAALSEVPAGWLRVLVALEDRHLESWRSWHGLDLVALTRAAVLGPLGLSEAGGSSLAMQLVRAMNDLNPARDRGQIDRYRRKWLEVRHAPLLYEALGGLEGDRFSRLLARHLPLVQGASGSRMGPVLHGIGLAARVLFDKSPADLDLAEQAVLAAAVRRHVMLTPRDHPKTLAEAEARWREVVARAVLGLRLAFGADDPRAAEAAARLRAMRLPQPQLPRLMAGAGSSEFAVAANPERRAATFLAGELSSLIGEILNRFGRSYRGRLTRVRLSLDVAENSAFKQALRARLADLERWLAEKLELRLVKGGGSRPLAQILVVAMDDHGRVIRHFTNSQDTLLNGSFRHRGPDLVFRRHRADRQIGSLAKIPIAVQLGRSDAPEEAYCNAMVDGGAIHNADGDPGVPDCSAPGAWYPARTVFARSLNLPLLWRLRSVPDASLAELAERMHLRLPPRVEARAALTLGLASAVPADLLAMMQAVARGAVERPALGFRPRLAREWRMAGGEVRPAAVAADVDVRASFVEPEVAAFVGAMLSAPLVPGGTLAALGPIGSHRHFHVAKSGTTTTSDGALRDKWILGALVGRAGTTSYLLLVGTGDPRRPLGEGISGNDLTPLVRSLLSHLTRVRKVSDTSGVR